MTLNKSIDFNFIVEFVIGFDYGVFWAAYCNIFLVGNERVSSSELSSSKCSLRSALPFAQG